MSAVNYSKWDNIECSDSSGDESPPPVVKRPPAGGWAPCHACGKATGVERTGACRGCGHTFCGRGCEFKTVGCYGIVETRPGWVRVHATTFWQPCADTDAAMDTLQTESEAVHTRIKADVAAGNYDQ